MSAVLLQLRDGALALRGTLHTLVRRQHYTVVLDLQTRMHP